MNEGRTPVASSEAISCPFGQRPVTRETKRSRTWYWFASFSPRASVIRVILREPSSVNRAICTTR